MTPDWFTRGEHFVEVGHGHTLYVQDWGKAAAKLPIVFLHGGPGTGASDKHKYRFVPSEQRVIFIDQRGCGKSTPKGSLAHNTTAELVDDIETIAEELKLKRFIITGGSWGSCLALAYAIKYPKRVHTLVLNGIFTGRQSEIDWLDKGGFQHFFPELWAEYVASVPHRFQNEPSKYHYQQMTSQDPDVVKRAAYAYSEQLEGPLLGLDDRYRPEKYEDFDPDPMRIEMHYLKNKCFLPENYIMDHASKLKMPIWLLQGRYDMVCPPATANELHQKLPNSHLLWTTAGHGNDRPNYDVNRTLLLQLTSEAA